MGVVMALKSGIKVAVISGSNSNAIKTRFDKFNKHGFEDLILGEENKMPVILTLIKKYGLNKEEVELPEYDFVNGEKQCKGKKACLKFLSGFNGFC